MRRPLALAVAVASLVALAGVTGSHALQASQDDDEGSPFVRFTSRRSQVAIMTDKIVAVREKPKGLPRDANSREGNAIIMLAGGQEIEVDEDFEPAVEKLEKAIRKQRKVSTD